MQDQAWFLLCGLFAPVVPDFKSMRACWVVLLPIPTADINPKMIISNTKHIMPIG